MNKTVFVLGCTGAGKTVLEAHLVNAYDRYTIFDVTRMYPARGFEGCIEVYDSDSYTRALNDGFDRILYRPSQDLESELDCVLNYLCLFQERNLEINPRFPTTAFMLDEVNRFVNVNTRVVNGLREIVERGRARRIEKLFAGQWFGTVPAWMRDSFSELYVFQHSDDASLDRFAELGFDADEIRRLPAFTCIHYVKAAQTYERICCVAEKQNIAQEKELELCAQSGEHG